ncbi:hypothetical protein ACLUTX_10710 [Enterobacterales bacterium AE_CKDN230030158-1A_HGKHYDSX7]
MSGPNKGFCLGAVQPDTPPPAPAAERRYSLRVYQIAQRRRSLPTVLRNDLPQPLVKPQGKKGC